IVAGGAGSGKTTLLNALLAEPAFRAARTVVLEDTAELQVSGENVVQLLTKRTLPQVTLRDLVQTALRLRPDRIIVGEVRGPEALDLLKAWNTGHPGGVATLHANSAPAALARLEQLTMEVCETPPRALIAEAIDLIVFVERGVDGVDDFRFAGDEFQRKALLQSKGREGVGRFMRRNSRQLLGQIGFVSSHHRADVHGNGEAADERERQAGLHHQVTGLQQFLWRGDDASAESSYARKIIGRADETVAHRQSFAH
ncbi:MAG: hypothetical protein B7Z55_06165, partial [Planctomycetales bacterium 12-60-4]